MEHTKKFDTFTKFAEADAVQLRITEKEWLDQVYEKIRNKNAVGQRKVEGDRFHI